MHLETVCLLDQPMEMHPLWSLGSQAPVGAAGLLGPGDEGTALESGRSWNVQFCCLHWPLILGKLLELLLGFVEYKLGVM